MPFRSEASVERVVSATNPHFRSRVLREFDFRDIEARRARPAWADFYERYAKRACDVCLSLVLLIVLLPVMGFIALAIRISSPGPALFAHKREGYGGKPFSMYKFRTMYVDSERMLEQYLRDNPDEMETWKNFFKLKKDPRVIPVVGSFLRATSFDELPQLFNVLRGDMSLVGPRPFPDYHLAAFDPNFRALRRTVRPGITGLWQVEARSNGDLAVQRALDTAYIANRGFWLDMRILLKTVLVVIRRQGAY